MTKNRIKTASTTLISSRTELEVIVSDVARLKLDLNSAKVAMDQELTAVRSKYQDRIARLETQLDQKTARVQGWSEENVSEFGRARSLKLTSGIIGFRTGQPKAKTLPGWTWARVLEKLKISARNYLRIEESVNKEALIADRLMLGEQKLKELGVKVVQEESFYIEPELQELDNRQTGTVTA